MIEILGVFKHSLNIEIILGTLGSIGIHKDNIAAVSLDKPDSGSHPSSSGFSEDESSQDLSFILATALGVIGAGVGYRLYLGPVIWGIGFSMAGFLTGYIIQKVWQLKKDKKNRRSDPDVVLIVRCKENQRQYIEQLMSENDVLGLTVFNQ